MMGSKTMPEDDAVFSAGDDEDFEARETTLEALLSTPSLEWIFVGGKGGVGKTTTSCSIAVELAKRRENVLIVSTDPAHNLSDACGQKFSGTASKVNGFDNLFAMEVDTNLGNHAEFTVDKESNLFDKIPDFLQTFPGIEDALALADLMQSVQTMSYSAIVFDTAPTGHTLRLLSFPSLMEKGLKSISSLSNQVSSTLSMFSSLSGQNVEEAELNRALSALKALASSVGEKFKDPTKATFVCVCIPEFLSIYETERLIQELLKRGIDCGNIVVNQVLFPIAEEEIKMNEDVAEVAIAQEADEAFEREVEKSRKYRKLLAKCDVLQKNYNSRRKVQSKYLRQVQDLYSEDFHVVCVPQMTEEVRGIEKLKYFSQHFLTPKPLPIIDSEA